MLRHRFLSLSLLGLASLLCTLSAAGAQEAANPNPVRIGMADTLFTDMPPLLIRIGSGMFAQLMKTSTGMDGEMLPGGDPLTLARKLEDGKVDLGVFHGAEFAWAQQRYPDLKPLMTAVTKYPFAQAHIVVRKESDVTCFADLKGKTFCLPLKSRAHCVLFMERNCQECGRCRSYKFFGKVVKQCEEDSLDDVLAERASAAVIDAVALESYEAIHPGRFARLQILKRSEQFPNGVIAYKEGAISANVLAKFRTGLLDANKTDLGKELMRSFKITSFENVPDNYFQMLAEIIKIYPPPPTVESR